MGESEYPIPLAPTIREAEGKAERMSDHTDIYVFDTGSFKENFRQLMKEPDAVGLRSSEAGLEGGLVVTRMGSAAVIYETGAAPCTLGVAFNEKGDAAIMHEPIAGGMAAGSDVEYGRSLGRFAGELGDGANVVISGTNVMGEQRRAAVAIVKERLAGVPDERIVEIYSREAAGMKIMEGKLDLTQEMIYGVCFVPKDLSNDGRNKLILLGRQANEEPVSPVEALGRSSVGTGGFGVSLG